MLRKRVNPGYRGVHSLFNEQNLHMDNEKQGDVEVPISEARRSVINERELFSQRREEKQLQREERQEEKFQKCAEKRRKKRMQMEKQTVVYGNRSESAN